MRNGTIVLTRGELGSLHNGGKACRVSCLAGRIWVTATGQREDFVLSPREEATFRGRGRIVIQALRTSTVRLRTDREERAWARALYPGELRVTPVRGL